MYIKNKGKVGVRGVGAPKGSPSPGKMFPSTAVLLMPICALSVCVTPEIRGWTPWLEIFPNQPAQKNRDFFSNYLSTSKSRKSSFSWDVVKAKTAVTATAEKIPSAKISGNK